MMYLKYEGSDGKEVKILIREKTIVKYTIEGGYLEIFFEVVPDAKPNKNSTVYKWSFKTAIRTIYNYNEVEAFLKSLTKLNDKKQGPVPGLTQTTMKF